MRPGGGVIRPEDFLPPPLPPAKADIFERAIVARSAREEMEQCRRTLGELDVVLLEQGLAKAQDFNANLEGWRDKIYVNLVSSDDS